MPQLIELILEKIWKFLISLKLAVVVIVSLAASMATATVIESINDTATAQYYVYRALWFYLLLATLGLNILAVALSRLPWKKRHAAFLMAHAGILMILIGSYLTATLGLDGSLKLAEGEVSSAVELDQHVLLFKQGESTQSFPFPWIPASVAHDFKPMDFPQFKVRIEKVISDADPKISFIPGTDASLKPSPAVQVKILGSPMGGAPEFWLWSGDPGWASQKLGPVRFLVRSENQKDLKLGDNEGLSEARFDLVAMNNGKLRYEATSIRGEKKSGEIDLSRLKSKDDPMIIKPGWRMPIQVQVKSFVDHAVNQTEYVTAKEKPAGMGSALPVPAIRISLISNPASKLWLGLGDRVDFKDSDGTNISVGYFPKRMVLPYAMRLKTFEIKNDPGTQNPAAYSSFVQVVDQFQKGEAELSNLPVTHITMNEPMTVKGYTFYQASYIPDSPRPVTTILSVNYDPGRALKYWGSLLLITGAIALFLSKAIQKKKSPATKEVSL